MLAFNDFEVLTFDCYGTLVDWESGILNALNPVLDAHGIQIENQRLLELYAEIESAEEQGAYRNYKTVLASVVEGIGERLKFTPTLFELTCLSESIQHWQPFPDTVAALRTLHSKFKLAIISNIDDDLFAFTENHLKTKFDWVVTAGQVQSYKPSESNFLKAIERMQIPRGRILHVAQSVFHDIVPAKKLGISTVLVKRRQSGKGFGATPPAWMKPDVEVQDLRSLVELIGLK